MTSASSRRYGRREYGDGPDMLLAACEHSLATGLRNFIYSGAADVPERLTERFPGLPVAGTWSPPRRPLTVRGTEVMIDASGADVVWVSLNPPKQERASYLSRVTASVLEGVGAAFDFHTSPKRLRWS